ncbi:Citrate transporter [Streptomyces alboniger]
MLPVLSHTASGFGTDQAEIAGRRRSITPASRSEKAFTASTFILVGMSGVQLGEHQRFIFRWAFGTALVMTAVAVLTGAISL